MLCVCVPLGFHAAAPLMHPLLPALPFCPLLLQATAAAEASRAEEELAPVRSALDAEQATRIKEQVGSRKKCGWVARVAERPWSETRFSEILLLSMQQR